MNDDQVSTLMEQHYTRGLAKSLGEDDFALRMWIIDNSGSMQNSDGRRFSVEEEDVAASDGTYTETDSTIRSSNSSFGKGILTKKRQKGNSSKKKSQQQCNCPRLRTIRCKRWDEIRDCINYQIELADTMRSPTSFRFLNDPGCVPQRFAIHMSGEAGERSGDRFVPSDDSSASLSVTDENPYIVDDIHMVSAEEAMKYMNKTSPGGCTPLTSHILDIQQELVKMEPQLRRDGKRVSITIATDGLPTDDQGYDYAAQQRDFVDALRMLEGLPVWVVIRLCTDEYHVVKFYNDLDSEVNLPMDVLDDYKGEAYEVYEANPWLNYALPLHRLREMGYHDRTFDLIDERLLTKPELYDFCHLLFGQDNIQMEQIPHPTNDWVGFIKGLKVLLERESLQWNPIKGEAKPWINLKKLNRSYSNSIFKRLALSHVLLR